MAENYIATIIRNAGLWDNLSPGERKELGSADPRDQSVDLRRPIRRDDYSTEDQQARLAFKVLLEGERVRRSDKPHSVKLKEATRSNAELFQEGIGFFLERLVESGQQLEHYRELIFSEENPLHHTFGVAALGAIYLGLLYTYLPEEGSPFASGVVDDYLDETLELVDTLGHVQDVHQELSGKSGAERFAGSKVGRGLFAFQSTSPHLTLPFAKLLQWSLAQFQEDRKPPSYKKVLSAVEGLGFFEPSMVPNVVENLVEGGVDPSVVIMFINFLDKLNGLGDEERNALVGEANSGLLSVLGTKWVNGNGNGEKQKRVIRAETAIRKFAAKLGISEQSDAPKKPSADPSKPLEMTRDAFVSQVRSKPHLQLLRTPALAKGRAENYFELVWQYRRLQHYHGVSEGVPIRIDDFAVGFAELSTPGLRSILIQEKKPVDGGKEEEIFWEIDPNGTVTVHGSEGTSNVNDERADEFIGHVRKVLTRIADDRFRQEMKKADPEQARAMELSRIPGMKKDKFLELLKGEGIDLKLVRAYLRLGVIKDAADELGWEVYNTAKDQIRKSPHKVRSKLLALSTEELRSIGRAGTKDQTYSKRHTAEFVPPVIDASRFNRRNLPRVIRARLVVAAMTNSFDPATPPEINALSEKERRVFELVAQGYTYEEIASRLGKNMGFIIKSFSSARRRFLVIRPPLQRDEWFKFYRRFVMIEYSGLIDIDETYFEKIVRKLSAEFQAHIREKLALESEPSESEEIGIQRTVILRAKAAVRQAIIDERLPLKEVKRVYYRARVIGTLQPRSELGFLNKDQLKLVHYVEQGKNINEISDVVGTPVRTMNNRIEKIRRAVHERFGKRKVADTVKLARMWYLTGSFLIQNDRQFEVMLDQLADSTRKVVEGFMKGSNPAEEAENMKITKRGYHFHLADAILALRLVSANFFPGAPHVPSEYRLSEKRKSSVDEIFNPETITIGRALQDVLPRTVRARLAVGVLTNSFTAPTEIELEFLPPAQREVVRRLVSGSTLEEIGRELKLGQAAVAMRYEQGRKTLLSLRAPQTRKEWLRFYKQFIILEYTGIPNFPEDEFLRLADGLDKDKRELLMLQYNGAEQSKLGIERGKKVILSTIKKIMRRKAVESRLPVREAGYARARARLLGTFKTSAELEKEGILSENQMRVFRAVGGGVTEYEAVMERTGLIYGAVNKNFKNIRRKVRARFGESMMEQTVRRSRIWWLTGSFAIESISAVRELSEHLPEELKRAIHAYIKRGGEKEAAESLGISLVAYNKQIKRSAMALRQMVANDPSLQGPVPERFDIFRSGKPARMARSSAKPLRRGQPDGFFGQRGGVDSDADLAELRAAAAELVAPLYLRERVQGSGFRVQGEQSRVTGYGLRVVGRQGRGIGSRVASHGSLVGAPLGAPNPLSLRAKRSNDRQGASRLDFAHAQWLARIKDPALKAKVSLLFESGKTIEDFQREGVRVVGRSPELRQLLGQIPNDQRNEFAVYIGMQWVANKNISPQVVAKQFGLKSPGHQVTRSPGHVMAPAGPVHPAVSPVFVGK